MRIVSNDRNTLRELTRLKKMFVFEGLCSSVVHVMYGKGGNAQNKFHGFSQSGHISNKIN